MEKDIQDIEDPRVVRRIVSKLCFIREDLEAIEKLDIKTEEIKQIIKGMRSRAELLMDIFFPKRSRG
jgi:uncharacterized protein YeeX (DUF496 family)